MNQIEITPELLAKLKKKANAATPGNWFSTCDNKLDNVVNSVFADRIEWRICNFPRHNVKDNEANSAFIAAANPSVVLALVARLEKLEKEADWLAKQLERFCRGVLDCGECGFMEACRGRGKWRQTAREAVEATND